MDGVPAGQRVVGSGRSRAGIALHAMGNVLLGVAIGLLAYTALTGVQAWLLQRDATARLATLGPIGDPDPAVVERGPALDFEGWAEEDRAFWLALEEGGVFGRLTIDELGVDATVVKGSSRADLMKGPGWIEWTELPGPSGTAGIAGHRTTYGAPFRNLDRLAPGDTIRFYSPYRRYTYQVAETLFVRPDQSDVMSSGPEPVLALSACHPPYSARLRIVVRSGLVEVRRLDGRIRE